MTSRPGLAIHDPKTALVDIKVFTDFLCTACYKFHEIESEVVKDYGDWVSVTYYNYPLDAVCNSDLKRSIYRNSCLSSRAILASQHLGFLDEYWTRHFMAYREIYKTYEETTAWRLAAGLADRQAFTAMMHSPAVDQQLTRDVELAQKLKIQATPTLFINGRLYVGSPGKELLVKIIETEINKDRIDRIKRRLNPLDKARFSGVVSLPPGSPYTCR